MPGAVGLVNGDDGEPSGRAGVRWCRCGLADPCLGLRGSSGSDLVGSDRTGVAFGSGDRRYTPEGFV